MYCFKLLFLNKNQLKRVRERTLGEYQVDKTWPLSKANVTYFDEIYMIGNNQLR